MSKKLLASCFIALSITSCRDASRTPSASESESANVATSSQVRPVVETPRAAVAANAVVETNQPESPVDALALPHEAPLADHVERAKELSTQGDVKGALAEARRAQFTTPDDDEVLSLIARLAGRSGQHVLAAEAWSRLAMLRPHDAAPLVQQARAHLKAKAPDRAITAAEHALQRDEALSASYQVLGLAQLEVGDLAGAIASLEAAVDIEPTHGWALNNLGLAYLRANENQKATKVLERAVSLLPDVAKAHNNLGVALERVGRKAEAAAAFELAMELSPKYVKAKLNAARLANANPTDEFVDPSADDVIED
jgi:tetratricopeptide (TPR) repeat protein